MPIETHRDQRFLITRVKLVAGDLFLHEAVIRLVIVERFDDVVAITPDVGTGFIRFEPIAVGVARHVQPMTPPALAVSGRCQQPVHHLFPGVGRLVAQKRLDFFLGRRKADHVYADPPEQCQLVGASIGLEVFLFELGQDERVDGGLDPGFILNRGYRRFLHGLECPVALLRGSKNVRRLGGEQQGSR